MFQIFSCHLIKGFNQLTLSMQYIFLHQVCLHSCGRIEMYSAKGKQ